MSDLTSVPEDVDATEGAARKSRLPVFLRRGRLAPFLTVVLSGQIIYAAFEAFKGSLMLPLQEMLGITQTQFGLLMGYIGIAMFLYVPAGWINNRFKVRTIIFWSLGFRLVTYLVLFLFIPSFTIMSIIAVSWGILDAIVWPAVVNGVSILSADQDKEGKGLAMGLLESIRRFAEFVMNGIIIIAMIIWADHSIGIMRGFAIFYTLLLVPMMYCVARFVPNTKIAKEEGKSDSLAALLGLLKVLARPECGLRESPPSPSTGATSTSSMLPHRTFKRSSTCHREWRRLLGSSIPEWWAYSRASSPVCLPTTSSSPRRR